MPEHASTEHPAVARPKRKSKLAVWWGSLSAGAQGILGLGAFAAFIVAGTRGCDSLAKGSDLAAVKQAQAAIDAKQDADLELLFQTTVRLTTDTDWLKREVAGVRTDLRQMDRGLPLSPLPTPKATPTP